MVLTIDLGFGESLNGGTSPARENELECVSTNNMESLFGKEIKRIEAGEVQKSKRESNEGRIEHWNIGKGQNEQVGCESPRIKEIDKENINGEQLKGINREEESRREKESKRRPPTQSNLQPLFSINASSTRGEKAGDVLKELPNGLSDEGPRIPIIRPAAKHKRVLSSSCIRQKRSTSSLHFHKTRKPFKTSLNKSLLPHGETAPLLFLKTEPVERHSGTRNPSFSSLFESERPRPFFDFSIPL